MVKSAMVKMTMVKKYVVRIVAVISLLGLRTAYAQSWNLPAALDAHSMKITFKVSTTWHTVEGAVKELSGSVQLSNPRDPTSIAAALTIPVSALDTDSASRDEEMRDSMDAARFPSMRVEMPHINPSCDEKSLTAELACAYSTKGTITIRDVTLPITLTGEIRRDDGDAISVNGNTQLDWSMFGVKDPSILIAQVNEQVKIAFHITLPRKKT